MRDRRTRYRGDPEWRARKFGRPLIDRDLSWLQFNERVLAEATQIGNPLLERVKFLAISASNLDEFFMIRVASLNRFRAKSPRDPGPARTYAIILREVEKLAAKQSKVLEQLTEELSFANIHLHRRWDADSEVHEIGRTLFKERITPHLPPPERYQARQLSKLENLNLAIWFPSGFWSPIPKKIPSVFVVPGKGGHHHIFLLDELLAQHMGPALGITGLPGIIRLIRDGDLQIDLEEEDTESIPDLVQSRIGNREKGRPVRLLHVGNLPKAFLDEAAVALRLDRRLMHAAPQSLSLHGLWSAVNQLAGTLSPNAGLFHAPIPVHLPSPFRNPAGIFGILREKDLLLHHPYDSFDAFVAWIEAACRDPAAESIELTVYRMDAVSPIIDALKRTGRQKKIRVLIELRARFDERNNLRLAEELREAGVEVGFGSGKLKLHAKVAIVVRREGDESRVYTHLSTGNYNAVTARQYTDLAILTANPEIGGDAKSFFDLVWKGEVPTSFRRLVTAPAKLHKRILQHIDEEIRAVNQGKPARIFAKVNALVDDEVIGKLYDASQAGVQVDLVVRGACSLVPRIAGVSQNIRVISIVDQLLEHSRIYHFRNSGAIYLSSADWMPRNFFSRLEIAFPVLDPLLQRFLLEEVIPAYLDDTVKGRELTSEGKWRRRDGTAGNARRSQAYFQELAARDYEGTVLAERLGLGPT